MEAKPYGTYAPRPWQTRIMNLTRRAPESWLGRRIALILRKPVLKTLGRNPVDCDVFGFHMRLYPHDNVSEKRLLFTPQFFDSAELALLNRRITKDKLFTFIDVGANAGTYSLFVASRGGENAKILAVEPQPEMLKRFATNVVLNDFRTIHVAPVALSDSEGTITLYLDAKNRGGASIATPSYHDDSLNAPQDGRVIVPCVPLLTLMDRAGIYQADAMKIDIEGVEDIVLGHFFRSAPKERWPKILFMERNADKWQENILSFALFCGYREAEGTQGRMNVILELAP